MITCPLSMTFEGEWVPGFRRHEDTQPTCLGFSSAWLGCSTPTSAHPWSPDLWSVEALDMEDWLAKSQILWPQLMHQQNRNANAIFASQICVGINEQMSASTLKNVPRATSISLVRPGSMVSRSTNKQNKTIITGQKGFWTLEGNDNRKSQVFDS